VTGGRRLLSPPFAADEQAALLVDAIARRRGKWVHEVLSLSIYELSLELVALGLADRESAAQVQRIVGAKGMVFPVLPLR
jgi:hypothetical protein